VTFVWLGVIVGAVGLNMTRYPAVSQMMRDSCQPQPLPQSAPPIPSASPTASKTAAVPARSASAAQSIETNDPPAATRNSNADERPSGAWAAAIPVVRVSPAALQAESAPPADPLDLGNGVRRLPPVD
jgi:hypothetical protein